ncbi:MAG TPA: 50S ribosomal protein L3 [Melioribacteraceae bacterium]|nr:50S ribosomal protein L3 [Melioribacteraceae bacterium]
MPGLLGKKLGMTSYYTNDGIVVPVTVIEVGPCRILEIKTKDKHGYEALKLGFGIRKAKHLNKAQLAVYETLKLDAPRVIKEFRNFDINGFNVGDTLTVDLFKEGEKIKVTAKSKGKGFQGVMKRHNFGGVGGRTHGQSDRERAPGSIGASSYPSRVFKGQRMAGRMGFEQVTVRNLKVVKVVPEKNVILVKGAVPGAINSFVEINK